MTTSIPESAQSSRNWDYRYCWLRDGYFVVDALNRLGATETMERYLGYHRQHRGRRRRRRRCSRCIGSTATPAIVESRRRRRFPAIAAWGRCASATTPIARSSTTSTVPRCSRRRTCSSTSGSSATATARCSSGSRSSAVARSRRFDQPDAGLWELRGSARVHTFSTVMCWAACDRLARIATRLGLADRAAQWSDDAAAHRALRRRALLERRARNCYRQHRGRRRGTRREPSAPRRAGFRARRRSAVRRHRRSIGAELKRGDFIFRYVERDDFGEPENAFLVCTFWYVNALAAIGRRDEARALFETPAGVPQSPRPARRASSTSGTGELWGNFVQTYSMVGLISVGDPPLAAVGRARSRLPRRRLDRFGHRVGGHFGPWCFARYGGPTPEDERTDAARADLAHAAIHRGVVSTPPIGGEVGPRWRPRSPAPRSSDRRELRPGRR